MTGVQTCALPISLFKPRQVALAIDHIPRLQKEFPRVKFFDVGTDAASLVAQKDIDIVVLATAGAAALDPFLSAVRAGKTVAPANKEALVIAGRIIMKEALKNKAVVIPVDSEQSAIFQCLQGHSRKDLKKVHLTASGGPLRKTRKNEMSRMTVDDVLRHPRWKMGSRITVNSATLMNKGFEVMEAQRLFGLAIDQIKVVVHPEALIHSLVEFVDGSLIAQLSVTDMRIPIQYALTWPDRISTGLQGLDLAALGSLTFEEPDLAKFPSLALALDVARIEGSLPAVLNAADEVAVKAFLDRKLSLIGMYKLVEKVVRTHHPISVPSIYEIKQADQWARESATALIGRIK